MTTIIYEKFSHSPIEKIFELATDFDNLQTTFPEFFPSLRVISVRPNTTLVESHIILDEKEFVVMAKHVIEKPTLHETFFVGGDAKGTCVTEKYERTSKGTKITISIDFKYKGSLRFSGLLKRGNYEESFSKIFDKLINLAEH